MKLISFLTVLTGHKRRGCVTVIGTKINDRFQKYHPRIEHVRYQNVKGLPIAACQGYDHRIHTEINGFQKSSHENAIQGCHLV